MASSEVATRSAWPCTSASAAPGSARVVRMVTSSPSRAKSPSASATRSGRYSGEFAGPAIASDNA
jgi:hypothetical protein